MKTEEIRMSLSIIEMENFKALITLKSSKAEPFIAQVQDFDYSGGEGNTKVILKKCTETKFPGDNSQDTYTLHLKDIKKVDRYRD